MAMGLASLAAALLSLEPKSNILSEHSEVWPTHAGKRVHASVAETLTDLGVEYLDLLLVHWPLAWDPATPLRNFSSPAQLRDVRLEDTWTEVLAAQAAGRVRFVGVSNFNASELESAPGARVLQIECHPELPQEALLEAAAARGLRVFCFGPLAPLHRKEHRKAHGGALGDAGAVRTPVNNFE